MSVDFWLIEWFHSLSNEMELAKRLVSLADQMPQLKKHKSRTGLILGVEIIHRSDWEWKRTRIEMSKAIRKVNDQLCLNTQRWSTFAGLMRLLVRRRGLTFTCCPWLLGPGSRLSYCPRAQSGAISDPWSAKWVSSAYELEFLVAFN